MLVSLDPSLEALGETEAEDQKISQTFSCEIPFQEAAHASAKHREAHGQRVRAEAASSLLLAALVDRSLPIRLLTRAHLSSSSPWPRPHLAPPHPVPASHAPFAFLPPTPHSVPASRPQAPAARADVRVRSDAPRLGLSWAASPGPLVLGPAARRPLLARPAATPTGPVAARLSPVRPPPLPWPRRRCSTKKGLARSVTHSALATSTSSGASHIAAPFTPGRGRPGGSAAVVAARSRAGGAGRGERAAPPRGRRDQRALRSPHPAPPTRPVLGPQAGLARPCPLHFRPSRCRPLRCSLI